MKLLTSLSPRITVSAAVALLVACSGGETENSTGAMTDSDGTTAGSSSESSGSTETSASDTTNGPPDLPDGQCWSEYHGAYWCECSNGDTMSCSDGISVCFVQDDEVITHQKWGPCGECPPGAQENCDADGMPGRRFCNVAGVFVNDVLDLPTPVWGECLLEEDIVCEPGESKMCDDVSSHTCDVDESGVPYWPEC